MNFRKVQCFKCKHTFMWLEGSIDNSHEYQHEDSGENLGFAICPECSAKMLVIQGILEGIPEDSEGIIKSTIRGI